MKCFLVPTALIYLLGRLPCGALDDRHSGSVHRNGSTATDDIIRRQLNEEGEIKRQREHQVGLAATSLPSTSGKPGIVTINKKIKKPEKIKRAKDRKRRTPPPIAPATTKSPTSPPTKRHKKRPADQLWKQSSSCSAGYDCLNNRDFGVQDPNKYNVDITIETKYANTPGYLDAYTNALVKWHSMITGDVESRPGKWNGCSSDYPATIDDLYICARDALIDGTPVNGPNILGMATPTWVRWDQSKSLWMSFAGWIWFDESDIPIMISSGLWESTILHEIGHIIGIGSLWDYETNMLIDSNYNYLGTNAINVWANDWGCTDSPPIEQDGYPGDGSFGSHWDEGCMDKEFMTGHADTNNVISTLTIAALADLGYTVDYSVADAYNSGDTTCCFSSLLTSESTTKPKLSDAGISSAIAFGQSVLSERRLSPRNEQQEDDTIRHVGGELVVVLVEEYGIIHDVLVKA